MDLRTERTKRSIVSAYMELRQQKPLEKITVKELAEQAYINKATFYTHYHDIFDLSDQLENELIESIIEELPHPESIVTNPALATQELVDVMMSKSDSIGILFSGSRKSYLSQKIYFILRKHIDTLHPENKDDLQRNIVLSVLIQGCFQAFQTFENEKNREEVTRIIGEINNCLKDNFL